MRIMKKLLVAMFAVLIVLSVCGTAMANWTCYNGENGYYPPPPWTYKQFTHLQIEIVSPGLTFATPAWAWQSGGTDWTSVNNSKMIVADGNTGTTDTIVQYWLTFNGDKPLDRLDRHMICSTWAADKSFIGAIDFYGPKGGDYWGGGDYSLYEGPALTYVEASAVPEPMSIMLGIMGLGSVAGFRKLRKK